MDSALRRLGPAVVLVLVALPMLAGAAQPVVIRESGPRSPRVVPGVDPQSHHRALLLTNQGIPTYPTVDVTCDGKRRAIALTRSIVSGRSVLAIYEVQENVVKSMLEAVECRLLLPDQDVSLPARELRAAWSVGSKPVAGALPAPTATARPAPAATISKTPKPITQASQPTSSPRPGVPPDSAGTCPSARPIKGIFPTQPGERCIYHVPGGEFYGKKKPDRCYATDAEAERDRCQQSRY